MSVFLFFTFASFLVLTGIIYVILTLRHHYLEAKKKGSLP